jgi:hypothetical protein
MYGVRAATTPAEAAVYMKMTWNYGYWEITQK